MGFGPTPVAMKLSNLEIDADKDWGGRKITNLPPLELASIPNLPTTKVTSGAFAVARGGIGLSTIAAGGILYASALDTLLRIAPTAANRVLRSTGANALEIASLVAGDIPTQFWNTALTPDLTRDYTGTAGTDVWINSPSEVNSTSLSYVKLKEIKLNRVPSSSLKIRWQYRLIWVVGAWAYTKLYRNGVPVGLQNETQSGSYIWTTPVVIPGWSDGDTLELWGRVTVAGGSVDVKDLQIIGTVENTAGVETELTPDISPLGVPNLNSLYVDVVKDWGGYRIANVGIPTALTDVAQADHSKLLNVLSEQHHIPTITFNLPTHNVGAGTTLRLGKVTAPAGKSVVVRTAGIEPNSVADLNIEVYNVTDAAVIYSNNAAYEDVDPMITYGGEGDVCDVRVNNATGGALDADAFVRIYLMVLNLLTVADFRANPATGTAFNPLNINDNNTASETRNFVGEYCEIEFNDSFYIKEFRHYGTAVLTGDGTWKIQYWDGSAWEDLNTGIATRALASWSAWVNLTKIVKTTKVRWVATTVDSHGHNHIRELEMRG